MPVEQELDSDRLRQAIDAGMPAAMDDLARLVGIASVSAPGFDPAEVDASAREVARLVHDLGVFDAVEIVRGRVGSTGRPGHPSVLATRAARSGSPTVLLYAHHDVQPPGDEAEWDSPAFEARVGDSRVFGRGSADDKGGAVVHLAALRALLSACGEPDLGLVLFVEGDEEMASPSLADVLSSHADRLAADVVVVTDATNSDVASLSLTTSLRGAVVFTVTVTTLAHEVHSGMFGGAVPDAHLAGVKLLATLWDDEGSVAVDGLATAELEVPRVRSEDLLRDAAALEGVRSIGVGEVASRLWHQPSIAITGMDAAPVAGAANVLASEFRARIVVRVAPGQPAREAFDALEAHLISKVPFGAHLRVDDLLLGEGFLAGAEPAAQAFATAMSEATGTPAVRIGGGGTIPFVSAYRARFPEAQVVVTGVQDPDTRAHAANESLHVPTLRRAILAEALFLGRLSRDRSAGPR